MDNHYFHCITCWKRGFHLSGWTGHYITEHMISCNQCTKTFETQVKLARHIKSDHREYQCPWCDKGFASKDALEEHADDVHQITCEDCRCNFRSPRALELHRNMKHSNTGNASRNAIDSSNSTASSAPREASVESPFSP